MFLQGDECFERDVFSVNMAKNAKICGAEIQLREFDHNMFSVAIFPEVLCRAKKLKQELEGKNRT